MSSHGTFYWNELMTRDVEKSKAFYEAVIGWTFSGMPMPHGTYWVANMGQKPVAGFFSMSGPDCAQFEGVPEHWLPYLAVDDVDARLKAATAAGATVIRPPFDVPSVGRIAILHQPGGAVIGWMTPVASP